MYKIGDILFDCNERLFVEYILFKFHEQNYLRLNQEDEKEDETLDALLETIVCICHRDYYKARDIKGEARKSHLAKEKKFLLDNVPLTIKGDQWTIKHEGKEYPKPYLLKQGAKLSLLRMYHHILTVINSHESEKGWIEWSASNGSKTYLVNRLLWDSYLQSDKHELPTGPAIEVMALQQEFSRLMKESINEKGLYDGKSSMIMNMGLLAYMMVEDGEVIPWKKSERTPYIDKKIDDFKTWVTLDIVLDISFFLQTTLANYVKTLLITDSGLVGPTWEGSAKTNKIGMRLKIEC